MSDEFDFGFTAVDEEELGLAATPPTPPTPSISPDAIAAIAAQISELRTAVAAIKPTPTVSSAQMTRVEEKIDRVLNMELHEMNAALQNFKTLMELLRPRRWRRRRPSDFAAPAAAAAPVVEPADAANDD